MNKKKILLLAVALILLIGMLVVIGFTMLLGGSSDNGNTMEIIHLDYQSKNDTGDYLALTNAIYQKALKTTKEVNDSVMLYQEGELSQQELVNVITQGNKKLTYYYLVAIQNDAPETALDVQEEVTYDLYLMRRGSEELLKFLYDNSSLRLTVGRDLLSQSISRENDSDGLLATSFAKYDINPDSVVIEQSVWDKEYTFMEEQPDLVIFKDLDSSEKEEHAYYLKTVNEGFMLVSWEIQNMYLAKIDYTSGKTSADQLNSDLEKSGFIINNVYDQLMLLHAPEGLEKLEKDTRNTMTLYHDALLEIQKFRMSNDVKHFSNGMIIIEQADYEAGRIGEFIYSVRNQYGF